MTYWAFCQFFKFVSSPIRSWDSGILNVILWNWTYYFVPTRNIFKLIFEVYNFNWHLQIIILSQSRLARMVNVCCCIIIVMLLETHILGPTNVGLYTLRGGGRGSKKVYCLYTHEHVDIRGWSLICTMYYIGQNILVMEFHTLSTC